MIKDPFALVPKDPFAGRTKRGIITITLYDGPPPNLSLACDPPISWMNVVVLLHDATSIALQYLTRAFNTLGKPDITLAKVDDDKALRNGN